MCIQTQHFLVELIQIKFLNLIKNNFFNMTNNQNVLNYYEVLEVNPKATLEEIKKSYQNLILKYHPDKTTPENFNRYLNINQAWQTLRNIEDRKIYDAEALQTKFNNEPILFDTVSIDEFSYDEENKSYFYLCRCSGRYLATLDMLNNMDNYSLISCDECSLQIKYLIK